MIKSGDMYRIKMDKSDGITPKGADTYRNKYIIVIGHDGGNLYGVVVTNTHDNHLVPMKFQYPLNDRGYKCYVNCYDLFDVSSERLKDDCFECRISDDDLEFIIGCVKTSPAIPGKILKMFGL